MAAFTGLAALAACMPAPIVPAPLVTPQPPYGPPPPPVAAPAPPTAVAPSGPAKIALLVPLSGPNAGLGSAILDAAQMALFETGGDQLTLVPRDTKGTPAGAAAAAHSAVDSGVKLILGPLLAAEVEAVTPIARDAHINVIAFSTVTNLAGGGIYLMGFLPRQEVVREVTYARQRGIARFATLAPDSPYGHLMADALRETAASSGATVTKTVFFDPSAGDPSTAIAVLLPAGPAPAAASAASPPDTPAPAVSPPPAVPPAAGGAEFRCAVAPRRRRAAESDRAQIGRRRARQQGDPAPRVRLVGCA